MEIDCRKTKFQSDVKNANLVTIANLNNSLADCQYIRRECCKLANYQYKSVTEMLARVMLIDNSQFDSQ